MIRPDTVPGVLFGSAADGDPRHDLGSRARFRAAGAGGEWAWVRQVHGAEVLRATAPGVLGEADAAFTTVPGLVLAVATADCYPVALVGRGGVGIAHAGWRGAAAGVVAALRAAMTGSGIEVLAAAVGPGIGPCCFEVGEEVAARFPSAVGRTDDGAPSVDLPAVIREQVAGLRVWEAAACTMGDAGFHSHRRDGTRERQVAVSWRAD